MMYKNKMLREPIHSSVCILNLVSPARRPNSAEVACTTKRVE